MEMSKLRNREELAKFAAKNGAKYCAEIGVYDGKYSEVICRNIPDITMFCIDTWKPSRNHVRQTNLDRALRNAKKILRPYNVVFMRMTSLEAAKRIPNARLDFIYIDALHDYTSVKMDLLAWYPKLKMGGLFAGHDWTHEGVTRAVKDFALVNDIDEIMATESMESDWLPSWYWVK